MLSSIALVQGIVLLLRIYGIQHTAAETNSNEDSSTEYELRIVSRAGWLAQPPEYPATPLELPADKVIIQHTATESCTDQASCTFHVRYIQTYHMESNHWFDIGCNFYVGGDGNVYEGRGWDFEGAHTKGYNKKSICIAFIGTFNSISPPQRQLDAAKQLIKNGAKLGKLSDDYKLFAQRQVIPTLSPGDKVYQEIQNWPHYSISI